MRIKNAHLLRGVIREIDGSQRAFAAAVGIHNSSLANILAGRRTASPDMAARICQRAQLDLSRVFIAHDTTTTAA